MVTSMRWSQQVETSLYLDRKAGEGKSCPLLLQPLSSLGSRLALGNVTAVLTLPWSLGTLTHVCLSFQEVMLPFQKDGKLIVLLMSQEEPVEFVPTSAPANTQTSPAPLALLDT